MATSATDALYQQYIAAGMSPEDARTMADFDLAKYQADYQAQQQFITNAPKYEVPGAYDYTTQYGGMDIIPGMTSGILARLGIQNPIVPVYQLLGSENDGNPLNAEERMQFIATPDATYRLKNNETGEIIGTASTPEELSALVQQSNALSQQLGKSANLTVERSNPEALGGGYTEMFTDTPDKVMNTLTKIALAGMVAATGAGLLQPGGLGGLGAAGTSGAGIGTTGSLAGAGLSSLPANLAAIQAGANAALAGAGLGTAAGLGATAGGVLGAGAVDALPGIVVTGTTAGGCAAVPIVAGTAAATGATAAATGGSGAGTSTNNLTQNEFGSNVTPEGDIVATAGGGTSTPAVVAGTAAAGTGAALTASGGTPAGATDAAISQNVQNAVDTAYTNAQTGAASDLAAAGYSGMGAGPFVAPGAGAAVSGGVFGTGLSLAQLASITGIGVDLLGKLLGGGGGESAGPTTPYVSPFGSDLGIGPAMARTQINPNIADYERYGFGPEALFFSGGQTSPGAISGPLAAPTTTTAATNPVTNTPTVIPPTNPEPIRLPPSVELTLDSGAGPTNTTPVQIGGLLGPATPANTGMTQGRLDQLQDRYENMRSGEFFNYFKAVNDVLGNYAAKGIITPNDAQVYQSRLEAAASTPGATLASLQSAVPMPQISDFIGPTGTRPVYTYNAPSQPIVDRSAYINDLYKQLGAQVSQGRLQNTEAQNIQNQLRQTYLNPQSTTEQLQNVYNTAIQQYRPLI